MKKEQERRQKYDKEYKKCQDEYLRESEKAEKRYQEDMERKQKAYRDNFQYDFDPTDPFKGTPLGSQHHAARFKQVEIFIIWIRTVAYTVLFIMIWKIMFSGQSKKEREYQEYVAQ